MKYRIKIFFVLAACASFQILEMRAMYPFTSVVKNECDLYLEKNDFSKLKPILYQYARTVACRHWLQNQGRGGHGIALYMLLRDHWLGTGKGEREIAADELIQVLENIMKFCIRFEQDIACWEHLGISIDKTLQENVKSKIYHWFTDVICEDRTHEFQEALKRVRLWFSQDYSVKNLQNHEYEFIEDSDDERQPLLRKNNNNNMVFEEKKEEPIDDICCRALPSPIWVRAMLWQDPNTIEYVKVDAAWEKACATKQNKEQFEIIRINILNTVLADYTAAGHARGFIELLRGVQKSWANTAMNYGSPILSYAVDAGKMWFGIPSKKLS